MFKFNDEVVFFDLETTSADPYTARIIQFASVCEYDERNLLINPDDVISEGATKVHGISNDDVKDLPNFRHHAQELFTLLDGKYWAGYNNARFDIPILKREFEIAQIKVPKCKGVLDGFRIFCHFYGQPRVKGARTLMAAHTFYCGYRFDDAHDALADIRATRNVIAVQLERHKMSLDEYITISQKRDDKIDHRGVFKFKNKEAIICVGKFSGAKIASLPLSYLAWIANNSSFGQDARQIAHNAIQGILPVYRD